MNPKVQNDSPFIIAVIEKILRRWKKELGDDHQAYLNHANRVYEYACILLLQKESKKLAIAAAFHDLDIWISDSMDYLGGSAELAKKHIRVNRLDLLEDEVAFIISRHHQFTKIKGNVEAEAFRKADLIDLSAGWIRYNIPKAIIFETEQRFPRYGFTSKVVSKVMKWAIQHPLKPFPMLRWN